MREFARIKRMTDLVSQLWRYDNTLTLGGLLEKWIWADYIESGGDIFRPEDNRTEERLKQALESAHVSSSSSDLSQLQKDVIDRIEELWPHVPDQRFGQFLSNYAFGHFMSHSPKKILQQNDEVILQALKQCCFQ